MSRLRFDAVLEHGRGGGALIRLPADVVRQLGGTRVRVRGRLNGAEFVSSTMPTGGGGSCLGVHKATRLAADVDFGSKVTVELEPDASPRTVEIPPELERSLRREPALKAVFDGLAHSHRREYAEWIAGAKKPETVARRVADTLERLRALPKAQR